MLKVLFPAKLAYVCSFNSLHQVCFPDFPVNLFSVYSFVKHSGGSVANDDDDIAIRHCIETVS